MTRTLTLIAVLACLLPLPSNADSSSDPVAVVERHLVAYNARDIDTFMTFFAPDAELYEFPDKLLAKGTEAIRKRYTARFAEPNLHADITQRIVVGNHVIDHEHIIRTFPEGTGTWEAVAISEVNGGVFTRMWFMSGAKTLDKSK